MQCGKLVNNRSYTVLRTVLFMVTIVGIIARLFVTNCHQTCHHEKHSVALRVILDDLCGNRHSPGGGPLRGNCHSPGYDFKKNSKVRTCFFLKTKKYNEIGSAKGGA